jgi:hypothetical protein
VSSRGRLVGDIAIAVLSLMLVPFLWAFAEFVTPGFGVARLVLPAEAQSFLGNLGPGLRTAAIVDFAVWFGTIWGGRELWTRFREERRARGSVGHWPNLLRSPGVSVGAMLFAVPWSYYVVVAAAVLFNHGRLVDWAPMVVGFFLSSFAACFLVVCGLYALAVRYWPRSTGVNQ